MKVQLASIYAIQSATKAVDLVHEIAGISGVREIYRFQRYFRDIHTITHHAFTSTSRYQSVGQLMLGLEPEWGFFYF